jgi:uncharacterized membrane protein YjfL (UPF0719 family)
MPVLGTDVTKGVILGFHFELRSQIIQTKFLVEFLVWGKVIKEISEWLVQQKLF